MNNGNNNLLEEENKGKNQIIINNDKKEEDDEWESIPENEQNEETKPAFYRFKFENCSKLKTEIFRIKEYHSNKIKKLEPKEIKSFYDLDKYIKENYINNITFYNQNNNLLYTNILGAEHVVKKKPEVGTNLIYEIDEGKEELKLIGTSDTWYEATIFRQKPRNKVLKLKRAVSQPIMKKKIFEGKIDNKNENILDNSFSFINKKRKEDKKSGISLAALKKKKRKRRKIKYTKDSTIIQIKRIDNNINEERNKMENIIDKKNEKKEDNNK